MAAPDYIQALNNDLLGLVFGLTSEYAPALRLVCRRWHAVLASIQKDLPAPARLADLIDLGSCSLLLWLASQVGLATAKACVAKATRLGDVDLVRAFRARALALEGPSDKPREWEAMIMVIGASFGHQALVVVCHDEWGIDRADSAMIVAASGGHEEVARLCRGWGGTSVNVSAALAASNGHTRLVTVCHQEWGLTDYKSVAEEAGKNRHHLIELMAIVWAQQREPAARNDPPPRGPGHPESFPARPTDDC